jgi:nucleotide-binding universal stress UspA family protein
MKQPILVATEGADSSLGAVRLGCALAERHGVPLHLIAVAKPPAVAVATSLDPVLQPSFPMAPQRRHALRRAVVAQLQAAEPSPSVSSTVEIAVDAPAPAIVRHAAHVGAGMIILGRGRLDASERWLGRETALNVVHLAHVPVLVVPAEATALPRRALVAVDFSEYSLDAARSVREVLGDAPELHLAHATWAVATPNWEDERLWEETYQAGAEARLKELAAELAAEHGVRVETTLLIGEPAPALLRLADSSHADLIAVGSHGYGYFSRVVMGSVSTQLLRRAGRSLLITPPRQVTVEAIALPTSEAHATGAARAPVLQPGGNDTTMPVGS